jgi:6-phosphogluconolactonase
MDTYVYVTISGADHLRVFSMDPTSGQLTLKHEVGLGKSGQAMCADPLKKNLYIALNEGDSHTIGSYAIDPQTGGLTLVGEALIEGEPCYLATDRKGGFLLAAYYILGIVTVHALDENGALRHPAVDRHETESCAHYIATDPSNCYAFVPHVAASNSIYQFHFDAGSGTLTANDAVPKLACEPGLGPRHLAFHPTLDIVYADNEQGSSVTVYRLDRGRGTLEAVQTLSTLPDAGFDGENSNAQLHIHPSGKAVYASNRGHDSIAVFAIDATTGLIRSLGQQPGEKVPRAFGIEPDGNFLLGGGDGSHRLVSYRIDDQGALEPLGEPCELGGNTAWVYPLKLG